MQSRAHRYLTALLTAGALALGAVSVVSPAAAAEPTTLALTLSKSAVVYGTKVTATVVATNAESGSPVPVAGLSVRFERSTSRTTWVTLATVRTDAAGKATVTLALVPAGRWTIRVVPAEAATPPVNRSNMVALAVTPARMRVSITGPRSVRSESTATLTVRVTSTTLPTDMAMQLAVRRRAAGSVWRSHGTITVRVGRSYTLRIAPWRTESVLLLRSATRNFYGAQSNTYIVTTTPHSTVYGRYGTRPQPNVRFAAQPAPVRAGANAVISPISAAVWRRMNGVSWQRGCPVGRSSLRYITVNYYGFDGYRHRGEIVVAARHATRAAAALTSLYALRYPIRQMRLVDAFGRGPYRGANDYASMRADNTSGFNCRYVVGRERDRILSPHSYGGSLDINPWENPYVARTGVFPNASWLPRSTRHAAVFNNSSDPAVRALTRQGFAWGGGYRDYHHFQRSSSARSAANTLETHGQPVATWFGD